MYDTGTPKPVFCDNVEGWDGVQDAGSGGVQKGGAYVHLWPIHADLWQNHNIIT